MPTAIPKDKMEVYCRSARRRLAGKPSVFDERSDVDLTVRGLDETVYCRVVSRLLDLDHAFDVDLIQMETAPENLVKKIEKEGIRL